MDESDYDSDSEYEFEVIIKGAVLTTLAAAAAALHTIPKGPVHIASKNELRSILLGRIYNGPNINCFNLLRISKSTFGELCDILAATNLVHESLYVSVKESVALFLYVLAHNKKFRDVGFTFSRSTDTISRHFGIVLRAILHVGKDYIKLPESRQQSSWKWFENCVGALDGTHIRVTVPAKDQGRFRNRKQAITTNVLGVCDKNMKFLYVLPGWEGSSSDSRVLRDAMERPDRFVVPTGKYYLVDAGYTNGSGFLSPYRSTRYHKWFRFSIAISALKEICNVEVNKEKITARLKTWNKYYHDVSAMLDTSGFGWDWERHMVKVDSEEVWANYIKAHPSVKHYKGKVIINWCDLGVLCGNDKATGSHAATANENVIEIDRESFVEESKHPGDRPVFAGEGSTKKKKKKSGGIDALAEAISSVACSMDKSFLGRHTIAADTSVARAQAIYVALGNIPQLERHELLKALDLLNRDTAKYGVFMTLPDELRLEWLRMQFT